MPAGDQTFYSVGPENTDPSRVDVFARLLNSGTPQQMIQGVELWTFNGSALVPTESRIAAATNTNVAASLSSVALLAANVSRAYASIYNDSSAILYVKLGTTASTTSFTVKLFQDDVWEIPTRYSGTVEGIWASATGAARVTEF